MDICSFLQVLLLKVCVSIRNVKESQSSEMVSLSGDRGSGVRDFFRISAVWTVLTNTVLLIPLRSDHLKYQACRLYYKVSICPFVHVSLK